MLTGCISSGGFRGHSVSLPFPASGSCLPSLAPFLPLLPLSLILLLTLISCLALTLDPWGYIGQIHDNLSISKSLITSVKSLLPYEVIFKGSRDQDVTSLWCFFSAYPRPQFFTPPWNWAVPSLWEGVVLFTLGLLSLALWLALADRKRQVMPSNGLSDFLLSLSSCHCYEKECFHQFSPVVPWDRWGMCGASLPRRTQLREECPLLHRQENKPSEERIVSAANPQMWDINAYRWTPLTAGGFVKQQIRFFCFHDNFKA